MTPPAGAGAGAGTRAGAGAGARAPAALALIVNPRAGGGRAARAMPEVSRRLAALGVAHTTALTTDLGHAAELARRAAARGEAAVAFGGDGLIGAVAGGLCDERGGVLGILPGGRGNDLARVLGIPLDPVAACEVLAAGRPTPMDLGQVEDRRFVGIASCGLDSVANRIANETRLVRGRLVYTYGALRALAGWRPATFTVEAEGHPTRVLTGYTIAAASARSYGGGMLMAPDASLSDGLLDVVTIAHVSKPRVLRLLPTVFSGSHVHQPNVEVVRCPSVRIEASRPFTLYADGDPIAELPATVSALPAAVQVLVAPARATAARGPARGPLR